MIRRGTELLEFLGRRGLNREIINDFKSCGMIYASQPQTNGTAIPYRFLDSSGIDVSWIELVDEIEVRENIDVYHIIINYNNGVELLLMYYDPEELLHDQLSLMKLSHVQVVRVRPEKRTYKLERVKYSVIEGGVVLKK